MHVDDINDDKYSIHTQSIDNSYVSPPTVIDMQRKNINSILDKSNSSIGNMKAIEKK
jgi:hypothetical protein